VNQVSDTDWRRRAQVAEQLVAALDEVLAGERSLDDELTGRLDAVLMLRMQDRLAGRR